MFAVDGEYIYNHSATLDADLSLAEIAVIPPISGGWIEVELSLN